MDIYVSAARVGISSQGVASKEYLDNLPKYVETISRQSWVNLEGGFNQLTDRIHALAVLGVLTAKSKSPDLQVQVNLEAYLLQLQNFVSNIEPSVLRNCPSLIVDACQNLTETLVRRKIPIRGISLLGMTIRMYQAHEKQLTSIHGNLLELCLAASVPKAALPYLTDDIDDFSPEIKGTDCKSVLLYFYYGGMVLAALKKFRESINFFEAAIQVPASTLSHIMLEAYKKLILVSLIYSGEVPPPHKSANQIINRVLKPNSTVYTDIANSFVTYNSAELNNVINRHQDAIARDGHLGLVKQVKAAQTKLSIQRLTKTFLTLSLADVASRVQLPGGAPQAESYILSMIQDGEIYAKINQKDGMVVFLDNTEKYDGPDMMSKIENQIVRCIELNKRLESMNDSLATNPEYISKVMCQSEDEGISSSKPMFSV